MGFCPDGKSEVNQIIKYILLLGTLLHWLIAIGLIGIGAWAFHEKNKYTYQPIEDVYDFIFDISIVFMVFGVVMFIVTTCGFIGALRENTILLRIFYYSLTVIFLLEVTGAILAFAFKEKAKEFLGDIFKRGYVEEYQDRTDGILDWFHENFYCCGIDAYTDFNSNAYFNCTDSNPSPLKCSVPYSCCINPQNLSPGLDNVLCGGDVLLDGGDLNNTYTEGCLEKVLDVANDNLPKVAAVMLAFAVPQIMGIVLGSIFVGQIRQQWANYAQNQRRPKPRGHHNHDRY